MMPCMSQIVHVNVSILVILILPVFLALLYMYNHHFNCIIDDFCTYLSSKYLSWTNIIKG